MNRSLIELTRYALGTDFLVKRIDREVIESVAKVLLPLFEKEVVEEGLLEQVVDELCKEQMDKFNKVAVDALVLSVEYVGIPEAPDYYDLPTMEELSVNDVNLEDITNVDSIDTLIEDYEKFKDEFSSARYDFESYMDDVSDLIDRMDDVIDEADSIILNLKNRKLEIEEDGQE